MSIGLGNRGDPPAGPGVGLGVRVGLDHPHDEPVGALAVREYPRALPGRSFRPDSSAGIRLITCAAVIPFLSITRAVHPHASTTTEAISRSGQARRCPATSGQAGDGALDPGLGAAPAVEPPRDAQDHRAEFGRQRQRFRWPARPRWPPQPSAGDRDNSSRVAAFDAPGRSRTRPTSGPAPWLWPARPAPAAASGAGCRAGSRPAGSGPRRGASSGHDAGGPGGHDERGHVMANGANAVRCRHAHRPMITMARSGSWSPGLMIIMGCMPARRACRAWRRIRR